MRQHFIPKFLLRAWTGTDHLLQVFKLSGSSIRPIRRSPKSVGWQEDLYSLSEPKSSGGERHRIETGLLQEIDNRAAKARLNLLNPTLASLSPEEGKDWALFLMSLRVRQPSAVEHLRESGTDILRRELDVDPEEYRSIAAQGDPDMPSGWVQENVPGLIENWPISHFPAISTHPRTLETILTIKHHSLVEFSGCSEHLLLSDDPCIWLCRPADPHFTVALPVSPFAAYIGTRSDAVYRNLRRLSRESLLTNLNISSVKQARKYIYARDTSLHKFIVGCRSRS